MLAWTLALLASVIAYSLTGLLAEIVSWDIGSHVAGRAFFSFCVALAMIGRDRRKPTVTELWSGVLLAVPSAAFVICTQLSNALYALVLLYTATFFAAIFRRLFLRLRLPFIFWPLMVVTITSLWWTTNDRTEPLGWGTILIGLFGAACWGAWSVARESEREKSSDYSLVIGFGLAALLFALMPRAVWGQEFTVHSEWPSVVGVVAGGLLAGAAYQVFSKATEVIPSPIVLLLSALEVPLTLYWLWQFLDKIPGAAGCAGAALATLAGLSLGLVLNLQKPSKSTTTAQSA